jgi:hypothetical protein
LPRLPFLKFYSVSTMSTLNQKIAKISPAFFVGLLYTSQIFAQIDTTTRPAIVSVNQSGYNSRLPKRFTAPLASDGDEFIITKQQEHKPLFKGTIQKGIGDFSAFNPAGTKDQFVITVTDHKSNTVSYPFGIGRFWLENAFIQPALDFMIDDRSVVGTHPSAYGGGPWRDWTYYTSEVPSMVLQYMANPSAYDNLPVQLNYDQDKARVLSPGFTYVLDLEGQNALATTRKYYTELDPPVGSHVPDIIQLMHWGIGFYMLNPVTMDPSGDPEGRRLHAQTVEQFAYFLYGFPLYKQYFTEGFYKRARDFAFNSWADAGLYAVYTDIGTGKGRECPGHSILPNLMMYEVALKEGDNKAAAKFFKAAFEQTSWIINNLDWNDPRTTKGQRSAEHKLLPALVYFLQHYPDKAPKGLREKIEQWTDVAISRSGNLWDFRRYDMGTNWTIPEYSESGNIAGFPAIALAAASVEPDTAKKRRLEQLAAAATDDLFGRNPQNACAPYHFQAGFEQLEKGWPVHYLYNMCARLETVRGSISSTCSAEMYPYNPSGKFRHPEGWSAFNAAWDVGQAYLTWYDTDLQLTGRDYKRVAESFAPGDRVYIQVATPGKKAVGARVVFDGSGEEPVLLKETSPGSQLFSGSFVLNDTASSVSISTGNGLFEKDIRLKKNNDGKFIVEK